MRTGSQFYGIMINRKPYPSDVSDDEWALVAPYLTLLRESAEQRAYPLREVFNALRYLVRYGVAWRALPNDLPPWHAVYDQASRWLRRAVSRCWPTTCARCCGWRQAAPKSRRRPCWTAHPAFDA